ncbi:MAG: hypothetical protein GC192_22150 [Bacteroidetes bacterium]|nr:hypothetical protein [Bacteroidota bacterium]
MSNTTNFANVIINIAVDASQVYGTQPGMYKGNGIYMMDNNAASGSSGEGNLELSSVAQVGQSVGFNVFVINEKMGNGAAAVIEGFELSNGTNVFGNQGWPSEQPAGSTIQWLGYVKTAGQMTYQIKIGVKSSAQFPMQYYTWDPFFNTQS